MEELTVEALLASLGYGSAEEYQRVLNNLWETTSGEYDSFLYLKQGKIEGFRYSPLRITI
jgi:ABC-type cobalt transport system substrate-binding protein